LASDDKDKEVTTATSARSTSSRADIANGTPRSFTVVSLRRTGMAMAKLGIDGIRYLGV
jgi:hypothetical protein